jgi:hypothetical protein
MAYDAATRTVVLFGGEAAASAGGQYLGDTWLWDGHRWSEAHPPVSPPPRMAAAMAYDASTGTIVLFGGEGNVPPYQIGPLGDTWTWDGTNWRQWHPAISPQPRRGHGMAAYPPGHGVVMFGGDTGVGMHPVWSNETWFWNGRTWSMLHPPQSPSPTADVSMVYDAATGGVLLYFLNGLAAEAWTWNGASWVMQHTSMMPPPRDSGALAYDAAAQRVVLFGGQALMDPQHPYLSDTWTWDGSTWVEAKTGVNPPAVGWATMAFDGGRVVLFGGYGISGPAEQGRKSPPLDPASTWLWNGASWTRASQS